MIYAIEPNIIENSTFGITEPIFLLLGLIAIYFILQKNDKFIPIAFIFAGLSFDTRINGIAIFFIILIACFLRIKEKSKLSKTLLIGITIFAIISFPHILFPLEDGKIPFISNVQYLSKVVSSGERFTSTYVENEEPTSSNMFKNAFFREVVHLGRINIPILFPLAFLGFLFMLKNFNFEKKVILLCFLTSNNHQHSLMK